MKSASHLIIDALNSEYSLHPTEAMCVLRLDTIIPNLEKNKMELRRSVWKTLERKVNSAIGKERDVFEAEHNNRMITVALSSFGLERFDAEGPDVFKGMDKQTEKRCLAGVWGIGKSAPTIAIAIIPDGQDFPLLEAHVLALKETEDGRRSHRAQDCVRIYPRDRAQRLLGSDPATRVLQRLGTVPQLENKELKIRIRPRIRKS